MFWVYILKNAAGIYYKGFTENLEQRIFDHQNDLGRFTALKGPWTLVFFRQFPTKREALVEEKRLKRLNKRSLEKIIHDFDTSVG